MVNAETVALSFVEAINDQQIVKMADLMTKNHVFIDSDGSEHPGHEEMRKGWMDYFSMVPDYRIEVKETFSCDNIAVLICTGTGTFTRNGTLSPENSWSVPLAIRAVIEDDKVSVWQIFVNPESMREILNRLDETASNPDSGS
jgi:hypothetical protein